jgi:hypothetical protein
MLTATRHWLCAQRQELLLVEATHKADLQQQRQLTEEQRVLAENAAAALATKSAALAASQASLVAAKAGLNDMSITVRGPAAVWLFVAQQLLSAVVH